MLQYIIKRLLLMIPTLFGITIITFCVIRLAPGDPVEASFGMSGAGMGTSEGGAEAEGEREKQILLAKVRLGLMQQTGTIRTWDPRGGAPGDVLAAHPGEVRTLAYSPDGSLFASASSKGEIILWDADRSRERARFSALTAGVNALAFSPDGAVLAAACDDRRVHLLAVGPRGASLEALGTLDGHTGGVLDVAFHPQGTQLATGARDRTVRIWDFAARTQLTSFERHYQDVTSVHFSRDGAYVISGARDRELLVWEVAARVLAHELPTPGSGVLSLALHPTEDLLAAGLDNNTVALVDLERRTILRTLTAHTGRVFAVAFDPAGRALLSASKDKTLRVWDLATGESTATLVGHSDEVLAAAVRPDGAAYLSAAVDTTKVGLLRSYVDWVGRLVRLDFGKSFKDARPVRDKLAEAIPISIQLNLIVIFLTYLCSIPIGALAAARRGGRFDQVSSVGVFMLYSMPSFWVATMLIVIAGSPNGWFAQAFGFTLPFVNLHSENAQALPYLDYLVDHLLHLVLPITAMVYGSFAYLSRIVRTSMLDVLGLDYIRTARAKGLSEFRVVGVHGLRNSLIPVVTLFGNLLPALIGGSVIIENIYSIPGMGQLSFDAIMQRDYPVIMGTTTCAAVLTMLGILVSDLLYCAVDPRIELK